MSKLTLKGAIWLYDHTELLDNIRPDLFPLQVRMYRRMAGLQPWRTIRSSIGKRFFVTTDSYPSTASVTELEDGRESMLEDFFSLFSPSSLVA